MDREQRKRERWGSGKETEDDEAPAAAAADSTTGGTATSGEEASNLCVSISSTRSSAHGEGSPGVGSEQGLISQSIASMEREHLAHQATVCRRNVCLFLDLTPRIRGNSYGWSADRSG